MIEWIGIACVAWTATELLRMSAAAVAEVSAPDAASSTTRTEGEPGARAPRRRAKRYAAWDDRGRPIEVEDLGATPR